MVQPLLHLSTHHTHFRRRRSLPPPARSQSDVHIIFRVTSTYMTSTCNQYNHRTPMPHAPVILFFSHRLYALYPLIYQLRPSFFLIIALHVSFPFCNFFKRAHLVSSRSSPLYRSYSHFLSRFFFFFVKAGRPFFFFSFLLSLSFSELRPKQLKRARQAELPALKSCIYSLLFLH